ncbi:ComEC/Rec2 family competence protein [Kangiella geojedonensis]|uniref:Metallohydrolase n=1 Tax=Kangiella geojedonensis TaxID=914150 RepID=A0A0F6TRW0_9GAMM|nr:hypothetical protein [Kangiella geojedonensis]AKE52710.1 hypothetical protein TQ33_1769 [Kangiella geojedonensis]
MNKDKVSFFPVGNGDTVLFELDGKTVLTDINHRKSSEEDSSEDYDIRQDIKDACRVGDRYELDIFVCTHPDKDHISGTKDLFHLGDPSTYNPKSGKILVKEIWCSQYCIEPNYDTEDSKPILNEIKRRNKKVSSSDGNSLLVMSVEDTPNGELTDNLKWKLLAPTKDEANIPKAEDKETPNSSNDSSIVIRWEYISNSESSYILLGGDAGVNVWERIRKDFKDEELSWSILLAPHHCSRKCIARKEKDEKYIYSDGALNALSKIDKNCDGFIVCSSKEVKDDADNPPSYEAKQKYLGILKEHKSFEYKERFINTAVNDNGKPGKVVFEFDEKGFNKKNTKMQKEQVNRTPFTYG